MKSRKEDLTNLNILEELNRKVQIKKNDEKGEFHEITNLDILEKLNRNIEIEKEKKK
ncbi:hypothetical protein [Fusobacterium varium]|uniref:hypothetical protein n=1 Tax=Fusobacterium varium TaxID=856 RepID=UPI000BC06961|nr:hypothetical protein [uncultured Fusobacterium sp.]BBA51778.1 hypothetical protein FV113G1_21280 [Fusobacterium varium]